MANQDRCFLETLDLRNYRCFPELTLSFDDRLTVLVAPNGGGKTAVLDGAAVALRPFVDTLGESQAIQGFAAKDARLVLSPRNTMEPITPVRLEAQGQFLGTQIRWAGERRSKATSRTSWVEAQKLSAAALRLRQQTLEWAQGNTPNLAIYPLISYYGTGRLTWNARALSESKKTRSIAPNARYRGYAGCLSASSTYRSFINWFRRFSYEARKGDAATLTSPHEPERVLAAVRGAVNIALEPSGWHTLEWDFAEDVIISQHAVHGRLPVDMLSDGIRNMIGLVADVAHRAARLNPFLGEKAALETPGIVLIDEVDMHLHPAWQQAVLESLQAAFPLVQFIVTTHSPQVLSTVPMESIRIIRDGAIYSAPPGTDGAEAQRILQDVFGVSPRPKTEMAGALEQYLRLVDARQWESPTALQLRRKLDEWSQGYEPSLVEADLQIANMKWEAGR